MYKLSIRLYCYGDTFSISIIEYRELNASYKYKKVMCDFMYALSQP